MTDTLSRSALGLTAALLAVVGLLHITPVYTAASGIPAQWVYNGMPTLTALTCAGLSALLWGASARSRQSRQIWGALAVGFLLWGIGDAIFMVEQLVLRREVLYPAAADVFFAVGYAPLAYGMAARYFTLRTQPDQALQLVTGVLFVVLAGIVLVLGVIPVLQTGEETAFALFISLLYPTGDLLLAFGASLVFLTLSGGRLSLPWALIPVGALLFVAADTTFIYSNVTGGYIASDGLPVNAVTFFSDFTYYAAYAAMALGIFLQARLQRVI
ncbi:MAG: hypothetical protein ACFB51_12695 [Anaerolineae bacterium]